MYCGETILYRCGEEFVEQDKPDPSWTAISEREAYMLTSAVTALNEYLTETQIEAETPEDVRARMVAVRAHRDQTRWNGDAYVTHPMRVARRFENIRVRSVAFLHDVVEDTDLTLDDLHRFGFSDEVIAGIDAVTKRDGESYLSFVLRAKKDVIGRNVKIADIEDNLSDLGPKKKSMRDKYELALWVLRQ